MKNIYLFDFNQVKTKFINNQESPEGRQESPQWEKWDNFKITEANKKDTELVMQELIKSIDGKDKNPTEWKWEIRTAGLMEKLAITNTAPLGPKINAWIERLRKSAQW